MMAKKTKKEISPEVIVTRLKDLEQYKNHLEVSNLRQDQIIDTFLNTTQYLLQEKLDMSDHFIEHQKRTIAMLIGKTNFIYKFLKEKGFEISDIFEFINDLRIKNKDKKTNLSKLNSLEKMLYMDLMVSQNIEQEKNEEEDEESKDDFDVSDI